MAFQRLGVSLSMPVVFMGDQICGPLNDFWGVFSDLAGLGTATPSTHLLRDGTCGHSTGADSSKAPGTLAVHIT